MIEWIKGYIIKIIVIALIGTVIECILPEGNVKKYGVFAFSIILSISMIQPFVEAKSKLNAPELSNSAFYIDYSEAIKATVNGVEGFENAEVYVLQENNTVLGITVSVPKGKLLEEATKLFSTEELKNMLSAVYGINKEKITITE